MVQPIILVSDQNALEENCGTQSLSFLKCLTNSGIGLGKYVSSVKSI